MERSAKTSLAKAINRVPGINRFMRPPLVGLSLRDGARTCNNCSLQVPSRHRTLDLGNTLKKFQESQVNRYTAVHDVRNHNKYGCIYMSVVYTRTTPEYLDTVKQVWSEYSDTVKQVWSCQPFVCSQVLHWTRRRAAQLKTGKRQRSCMAAMRGVTRCKHKSGSSDRTSNRAPIQCIDVCTKSNIIRSTHTQNTAMMLRYS